MNRPRIVGERANATGSKAFHDLIAASDWDGAVDFALAQVSEGAEFIDICLIAPDRDEFRDTADFYARLDRRIHPPVFIDSLNVEVTEMALSFHGPGATLNSASLQDVDYLKRICSLANLHRTGIVIACRDSRGLAVTATQKLAIAQRAFNVVTNDYGIAPESIILDVLAIPVLTSPESLPHTLSAIEQIHHEIPQVRTLIGLSNLSYGLPDRDRAAVERSALMQARAAGLDFAILNTARHPATL